MKKLRLTATTVALTLGIASLAGCNSTDSSTSTSADTAGTESASQEASTGTEAPSGEVKTLTFYNADGQEDPWTDPIAEEITRRTGMKLETSYPINQDDETVALMIAEQNYADMIFAKGDAGKLIEAGALIDLTDLIEEYGPNIKKMYGDELDKLRHSPDDPAIYQLSSYGVGNQPYTTSGSAQIKWQVLKENNYEIPETIAEFEEMLREFVEANPTTEDGQSYIPLSLSTADWHWLITLGNPAGFIAEGQADNGQWLVDENYEAIYKFRSEKVREYFRWLNHMYTEGLLDPDFATQTHEDYIAKIAAGRVLALTDADWDYADGERILEADGKFQHTYAPLPLTMDAETKNPSLMYQGLTTGYGIGISVNAEDPVAAIKYLDFIASDEGQVLVNWGIEGENYTVDENGMRQISEEDKQARVDDPDYAKNSGIGFHNYPFPAYGAGVEDETGNTYTTSSKENVIDQYNVEEKAALEAWDVELLTNIFPQPDEFEVPPFSPIWAYAKPAEFDEIGAQLDEVAWAALVSLVIDTPENFDANYDKMIEDLEGVGMTEAEAMLTEILAEKIAVLED